MSSNPNGRGFLSYMAWLFGGKAETLPPPPEPPKPCIPEMRKIDVEDVTVFVYTRDGDVHECVYRARLEDGDAHSQYTQNWERGLHNVELIKDGWVVLTNVQVPERDVEKIKYIRTKRSVEVKFFS